ncbi:MAG: GNAT family N-acetyltransferase [Acidimicrobiia bacterium]|nr:GNAT family N-acetyltransferase [Acidimicrobiia bacterium]
MTSERLTYQPVSAAYVDSFHSLIQDAHVRQYLCDGNVFPREWSEERVRDSSALFESGGVGLWLAYDTSLDELVGFCGFLVFPSLSVEPQLVYAMFERWTGRGYATEMARAAIAEARTHPGFDAILAGVDAVNAASVRVLVKLGFRPISSQPGAFGETVLMGLDTHPLRSPG